VLATPRCLDWRRDLRQTSRTPYGSWAGPSAITFGRDGKPTYVSGPYDNPAATHAASRSTGRALLAIVQEIGAVAGWAAVVGLAVLSALYLSHARDVKRLREWAGRAPERSGRGVTAVPGRAAGVPPPGQPQTAATASGAPASLTGPRPATPAGASGPPPVAPQPVRRTLSPQRPITRPAASRAVPQQTVIIPPRRSQRWYSRIGTRYVAVALVGMLVLGGAAAYGVTQLTGDDGGDSSGNARANNGNRLPNKPKPGGAAVKPGNVTVAVLNGTTVPGLAAMLRDQIAAAGFKKGTINVFSDQQLAESVVEYAPGHQAAAKAVSRRLGISQLEPVTSNSRALAGAATVIVIAGADKAP
jgi:LytR cell envelope-related transcriptional attenuator